MSKKWGCALAVAGWLCTVPAQAVEIQFVAQDLADVTSGQDLWRYVYRVTGSFAAGSGFNVLFGPTYGALEDFPTAPNGDWMTSTTPPFAGADSLYTAIAQSDPPSMVDPFVVRFVWLGTGTPGSQPFEVFDDQFNVVAQGQTVRPGTTSVPEPGSLLLIGGALALLRWPRRPA